MSAAATAVEERKVESGCLVTVDDAGSPQIYVMLPYPGEYPSGSECVYSDSDFGKAIIGKAVGDSVEFPKGIVCTVKEILPYAKA